MNGDTDIRKPVALINLSSSTSEDISALMARLFERYGYARPHMIVGRSADMADMLQAVRDHRGDLLISFGGDGTSAAVAEIAREQNVPFLPLPGGTMNLLPLALYGSDDWQTCLIQGLAARPRRMTVGCIEQNDSITGEFLVGAIFGHPTRMNKVREDIRSGQIVDAARDTIQTLSDSAGAPALEFTGDGESPQSVALINTLCPFMSGDALNPDHLDITLFEKVTGGSAISLGLNTLLGNLKNSQAVDRLHSPRFHLRSEAPIEALLDGEAITLGRELSVCLDTQRGIVMAPKPAMSFPTERQVEENQ